MCCMPPHAMSATEHAVWRAFPRGEMVDLSGDGDRAVRAEVITALLLGGQEAERGRFPALRLTASESPGRWSCLTPT